MKNTPQGRDNSDQGEHALAGVFSPPWEQSSREWAHQGLTSWSTLRSLALRVIPAARQRVRNVLSSLTGGEEG